MYPYAIPFWKEAPFVRLLVPLIVGICLQKYLHLNFFFIVSCIFLDLIVVLAYNLFSISFQYKWRKIHAAFILLLVFFLGIFLKYNNNLSNNNYWYGNHFSEGEAMLLRIDEPIVLKSAIVKTTASVKAIVKQKSIIRCDGKIIIYIRTKKAESVVKYGDFILTYKLPRKIRNAGNPGSFDYQQYQSDQQIYDQLYLNDNDYLQLNFINKSKLIGFIIYLKNHTISILKKYIHHPSELGIAEALLIGYKNDLDNEIVRAYSKTGVVHIIAISGLHLGLIYFLLIWVLDRIPIIKKSKSIKCTIVILSLWMFSLITGSSASVLRSAVMFTCMAFGKLLNKESSIYNSLCASAFILLVYNPNFLWDVGFQLSYMAIIGIVLLQKPIQHMISTNGFVQRKLWEMTSITLAAQIFTFPICLFYFHQFPVLFLISNLVSVPLSTMILFMEIVLISFSGVPVLSDFVGLLTVQSIKLLNGYISFISNLPYSNIDHIYSDFMSTVILYAFLITVILLCFRKNKFYLKLSLIGLSIFCCCVTIAAIRINFQKKIIFYNYSKKNVIDFINGNNYYSNEKFNGSDNNNIYGSVLLPARNYYGSSTESIHLNEFYRKDNIFQFYNKIILVLDTFVKYEPITKPVQIDFLYISNSPRIELSAILHTVRPKVVLFAASNKISFLKKWKQDCDKYRLCYFSIKERGAYVCEID